MNVALLEEMPIAPTTELGPFRRRDYEALPDEPRCELILGRFYVSPSPFLIHQIVGLLLYERLAQVADSVGGLAVAPPMDVHLNEHSVVQPDVIYVSPSRREVLKDWIEGAPDLLVEVLSPGSARRDRVQKLNLYAASGVREYWLVDPHERQIDFLVNQDGRFAVTPPSSAVYQSPVLPEISLDLVAFWAKVEARLGGRT